MQKRYTTDDIAEMYRVCRKTVWTWVQSGLLRGERIGRRYLFSVKDIEEFEKRWIR